MSHRDEDMNSRIEPVIEGLSAWVVIVKHVVCCFLRTVHTNCWTIFRTEPPVTGIVDNICTPYSYWPGPVQAKLEADPIRTEGGTVLPDKRARTLHST